MSEHDPSSQQSRKSNTHRVLILSLQPYKFATRPKKAAEQFSLQHPTIFLAPSKIGRSKQWDKPHHGWVRDNLIVKQISVGQIYTKPTTLNQLRNAGFVYLPLLARWGREVLRTPAEEVFATSLPLAPLAVLHKLRFRSTITVDVNERPGAKTVQGSVTTLLARVEPAVVKLVGRFADRITTATSTDRDVLAAQYPSKEVRLLRNVPLSSWRARYTTPPASRPLRIVTVGSVFEGRAFEILIAAISLARSSGTDTTLDIFGAGRDEYLKTLRELITSLGLGDSVKLYGRISGDEVSAAYLTGDVGLALYEQSSEANDGLSNKILECVSTGRPVIAGDLPENRRFVTENGVGWLTDVTPEALAATISTVATSNEITSMAEKCRTLGDTELSWEQEFSRAMSCTPKALLAHG